MLRGGGRLSGGDGGQTLAHPLKMFQVGPVGGETDDDATSAYRNLRRHFDEQTTPGAGLSLGQRITPPTPLLVTPTCQVWECLRRHGWGRVRRRRQRHWLAE